MTRGIDDEQSGKLVLLEIGLRGSQRSEVAQKRPRKDGTHIAEHLGLAADRLHGEVSSSNLLSNTSGLALLYVGLTDLQSDARSDESR